MRVVLQRLLRELCPALAQEGRGARALCFTLYRVDGETSRLTVRLSAPSRDAAHMLALFALRLDGLATELDAGFGYDAAALDVLDHEPMPAVQQSFAGEDGTQEKNLTLLIDRLGSRLGIENVRRLHPRQSHIPERAVVLRPAAHHPAAGRTDEVEPFTRPLLMLPAPEPVEVTALLPEGPPSQFRWRRVRYSVAHAEGPERLRPEWWQEDTSRLRDYYVVEDEEGHRFWLYREGRYGDREAPRWFVHGVFP
jgi:protein ImuB